MITIHAGPDKQTDGHGHNERTNASRAKYWTGARFNSTCVVCKGHHDKNVIINVQVQHGIINQHVMMMMMMMLLLIT